MNQSTRQTINSNIMPAVEFPLTDYASGEQFADDVIALAETNWDGELPGDVDRDDLIEFWQDSQPEFTMQDSSSQPYAWTLEGVDMEGVISMGAAAYVEDYVRTSIDAWNLRTNRTVDSIYAEWRETREYDQLISVVEDAIAAWELAQVMTTSEAAEEFGIEQITVIKNIERGNIPGRKSGGTWLIRRADALKRWGKSPALTLLAISIATALFYLAN